MDNKYHNFRIAGTRHISPCGHDSTPGNENEPFKTIRTGGSGSSGTYVVGTGTYTNNITGAGNYVADGDVVWESASDAYVTFNSTGGTLRGFHIRHARFVYSSQIIALRDCILEDSYADGVSSSRSFAVNDSVVRHCPLGIGSGSGGPVVLEDSVVHNASIMLSGAGTNFPYVDSAYVAEDVTLYLNSASMAWTVLGLSRLFSYSCIRGLIIIDGVPYEVKRRRDSSPALNTDPSVADIATAPLYLSLGINPYSYGLFNEEAGFYDLPSGSYALSPNSPLLRAGRGGAKNIGGRFAQVGGAVRNSDDGNAAGVRVLPGAGFNTTNPDGFILKAGETESYVDYVFPLPGLPLTSLGVEDFFTYDTDAPGGSVRNSNVVDAEPLTVDYARYIPTSAAAQNTSSLVVPANAIQVGQHVRVNGQCREVTSKTSASGSDTLQLSSPLLAVIGAGVDVTFGSVQQLAALNPNRLTIHARTRSSEVPPSIPLVDAEWDNEVSPVFGVAGKFFNQELNRTPGLIISNNEVFGVGDSNAPVGLPVISLAGRHANVRVYKRNNQSAKGLPWR